MNFRAANSNLAAFFFCKTRIELKKFKLILNINNFFVRNHATHDDLIRAFRAHESMQPLSP
jgi:hypothetical protein